jgi:spore coat protein U-like protein
MKLFTPARFAALCIAALACAGAHADNQNITVSATVSGVCKLTAVPNMSFALDPTSSANGSATSAIQYKCTKGTAPTTFSVGGSSNGTFNGTGATALAGTGANADTIPYTITWTAPSAQGSGFGSGSTATTVELTGTILNANYVNVQADTYSRQVAIVINP